MNYTEIEAKVREATNDDAWGPTGNFLLISIQINKQVYSFAKEIPLILITIIFIIAGAMMQELAQSTFTYEQFPEVMSMLWKRMLQENKRNWRRTYKVCVFF